MAIRNEAARLFFAITALILVTMLSAPQSDSATANANTALKRQIASFDTSFNGLNKDDVLQDSKVMKKAKKTAEKKISRKIVKKT